MTAHILPTKLIRSKVLKTQVNQLEMNAFNVIAKRLGQTGGGFLRQLVCQAINEDQLQQQERQQRASLRAA